jgi:hypothetical protein
MRKGRHAVAMMALLLSVLSVLFLAKPGLAVNPNTVIARVNVIPLISPTRITIHYDFECFFGVLFSGRLTDLTTGKGLPNMPITLTVQFRDRNVLKNETFHIKTMVGGYWFKSFGGRDWLSANVTFSGSSNFSPSTASASSHHNPPVITTTTTTSVHPTTTTKHSTTTTRHSTTTTKHSTTTTVRKRGWD